MSVLAYFFKTGGAGNFTLKNYGGFTRRPGPRWAGGTENPDKGHTVKGGAMHKAGIVGNNQAGVPDYRKRFGKGRLAHTIFYTLRINRGDLITDFIFLLTADNNNRFAFHFPRQGSKTAPAF